MRKLRESKSDKHKEQSNRRRWSPEYLCIYEENYSEKCETYDENRKNVDKIAHIIIKSGKAQ